MELKTPAAGSAAPTLLQMYDFDLQQLEQRVGKDRSPRTYVRQRQLRQHVADFLAERYHLTDIPLSELTERFIYDYASYLSADRHQQGGTVWLSCQQLKSVVHRAQQRGLMQGNPFFGFRIGRNIRPREYLTEQELAQVVRHPLKVSQQAFHRDLFVFSALTGMSFADINRLRHSDLRDMNGEQWIFAQRQKTGTPFQVRLIQAASDIIRRYDHGGDLVFGPLKYRTLAQNISRLMESCGIGKRISFHCARHTFAVMALNAGLPIESVSRVLGHTNIKTTQIYAKITMQKLSRDMDLLDASLRHKLK